MRILQSFTPAIATVFKVISLIVSRSKGKFREINRAEFSNRDK